MEVLKFQRRMTPVILIAKPICDNMAAERMVWPPTALINLATRGSASAAIHLDLHNALHIVPFLFLIIAFVGGKTEKA